MFRCTTITRIQVESSPIFESISTFHFKNKIQVLEFSITLQLCREMRLDIKWSDMTWYDVTWHDMKWQEITWPLIVKKDTGKKNYNRNCLRRNNLVVMMLASAKRKQMSGILNSRHFDAVCFYENIIVPIPSHAGMTRTTNSIMRSHFASTVSFM